MTAEELATQLERIADDDDRAEERAEALIQAWRSAGVGAEAIAPILRFMEAHPDLDLGPPGPLVHFIEQFFGSGYEEALLDSVGRRPTGHTVWMINRVINGTQAAEARGRYVEALKRARLNPRCDEATRERVDQFLERLSRIAGQKPRN